MHTDLAGDAGDGELGIGEVFSTALQGLDDLRMAGLGLGPPPGAACRKCAYVGGRLRGVGQAGEKICLRNREIPHQKIQKLHVALEFSFGCRERAGEFDCRQAPAVVNDRDQAAEPVIVALVPVCLRPKPQLCEVELPGFSAVVRARVLQTVGMTRVGRRVFGVLSARKAQRSPPSDRRR